MDITEQTWRLRARNWGSDLIGNYNAAAITPYIHLFIYHIGAYLEEYGSVEKFANYAIESKHKTIKGRLYGGTRGRADGVQSKSVEGRALSIRILRKDLLDFRLNQKAPLKVKPVLPTLLRLSDSHHWYS